MRFRQAVKIYARWLGDRHQYRASTLARARRIAGRWTRKTIRELKK